MNKKYLFLIMLSLIFSLTGCNTQTTKDNIKTSSTKTESKQTIQKKVEEKTKYSIDKIIIATEGDLLPDVQVYQDFNFAVIKEMAKEYNIPVETKELPTFNDLTIALQRGDINVIPGIVQTYRNPDFSLTYTYFTGAIYRTNGEQLDSKKSYSMLVRKTDKELFNFFNDMISKFNDTGKLKQLEKQFLGERNKLN